MNGHSSLVVCFGEMLIDFVPTVGGVSLAEAPAFAKGPGGAPANVAAGVSKLGGSSAFIGKVGKDEFGFMLADILKQNGVDNSGISFSSPSITFSSTFSSLQSLSLPPNPSKPQTHHLRSPPLTTTTLPLRTSATHFTVNFSAFIHLLGQHNFSCSLNEVFTAPWISCFAADV